jgi:hypothetical protein
MSFNAEKDSLRDGSCSLSLSNEDSSSFYSTSDLLSYAKDSLILLESALLSSANDSETFMSLCGFIYSTTDTC